MRRLNAPLRLITLLTDFGSTDGYVAEVKGTLLAYDPRLTIVDITHQVPAFDIEAGARLLGSVYKAFPAGTVHLAVVDPGVDGFRKPLILASGGCFFVGPDNGLFTQQLLDDPRHRAYEILSFVKTASPTFHGRDIFAPVAARLSNGFLPSQLGKRIQNTRVLGDYQPTALPNRHGWKGKVTLVDHFGNVATNFPAGFLKDLKKPCIQIGKYRLKSFETTFGEGNNIRIIANSQGYLEIIMPRQSASRKMNVGIYTPVILTDLKRSK